MKQISSKQICSKMCYPTSYTLQVTHACSLFTWIFSTYLMHVFLHRGYILHILFKYLYASQFFQCTCYQQNTILYPSHRKRMAFEKCNVATCLVKLPLFFSAEFLDVIGTKVFRVFLLASQSFLLRDFTPLPLERGGLKLVCNVNIMLRKPQGWELSRLSPETQRHCTS